MFTLTTVALTEAANPGKFGNTPLTLREHILALQSNFGHTRIQAIGALQLTPCQNLKLVLNYKVYFRGDDLAYQ